MRSRWRAVNGAGNRILRTPRRQLLPRTNRGEHRRWRLDRAERDVKKGPIASRLRRTARTWYITFVVPAGTVVSTYFRLPDTPTKLERPVAPSRRWIWYIVPVAPAGCLHVHVNSSHPSSAASRRIGPACRARRSATPWPAGGTIAATYTPSPSMLAVARILRSATRPQRRHRLVGVLQRLRRRPRRIPRPPCRKLRRPRRLHRPPPVASLPPRPTRSPPPSPATPPAAWRRT
jgi:hypothetical protein